MGDKGRSNVYSDADLEVGACLYQLALEKATKQVLAEGIEQGQQTMVLRLIALTDKSSSDCLAQLRQICPGVVLEVITIKLRLARLVKLLPAWSGNNQLITLRKTP